MSAVGRILLEERVGVYSVPGEREVDCRFVDASEYRRVERFAEGIDSHISVTEVVVFADDALRFLHVVRERAGNRNDAAYCITALSASLTVEGEVAVTVVVDCAVSYRKGRV